VPEDVARLTALVPRVLAERRLVLPLAVRERRLELATADPLDLDAIRDVEFVCGLRVLPQVATPGRLRAAIARAYALAGSVAPLIAAAGAEAEAGARETVLDLDAPDESTPVVRIANHLVSEAVAAGASDVHIEPRSDALVVRNRIDGLLRDACTLPRGAHAGLVSRLKILAHLDIAERRRPQDGRIKVRHGGRLLDLRVSTLPTHCGEKVVLRLLDPSHAVLALARLGLEPVQQELLEATLAQPQGTVLVTGPTGSGKTSTLYAALSHLKSPGINIVTLENPVEFQIAGVTQVHMNERAGLTFAASLRSIVRQDPDVIMVGEIRDSETAVVAFQAALTGHFVLSTLHTNNAAAAVTRLLDLGVEPFLIASSVSLVVAQRLVRVLCHACRQPHRPSADELARLRLRPGEGDFHRAGGCERCHGNGFRGRIGVFEMLAIDARVRQLVTQRATEAALQREASARGQPTLLESAACKVARGVTSTEEALRVVLSGDGASESCPTCGAETEASFTVCPACEAPLRRCCAGCRAPLQPAWRVCPFCATQTVARAEAPSGVAGAGS